MRFSTVIKLTLLVLLTSACNQGDAMGIFRGEKKEAILFSPMEGQLTFGGKPAAGAIVKLWIKWDDPEGSRQTFTADQEGKFQIPEQRGTYRDNPLFQLVIAQEITVQYEGNDFLVWTLSKTNTHRFGELGGAPLGLRCELTDDLKSIRTDEVLMGTVCKWESIGGMEDR